MTTTLGGISPMTSPLLAMTRTTPTALWCDSARPADLEEALAWGTVGSTCNPVLALAAFRADAPRWRERVATLAAERPRAGESQLGRALTEELTQESARLLEPVFAEHGGRNGRVSVQTDPRIARDPEALVADAVALASLAPNIVVKIPAVPAGIEAIEEVTARGISINATVSFSVAQSLAVGEAVERGLVRAAAAGHDVSAMGPVCTVMVGRLDDWLKIVAEREGILVEPGHLDRAGVAVVKRAYALYRERGYRTRMLSAAFRTHLHWSELVGGDLVISPPMAWHRRIQAGGLPAEPRIDDPVDAAVVRDLLARFPDFRRAYEPDGLAVDDLWDFAPTRRTMRQFLAAAADLDAWVRDVVLPDPA